MIGVRGATVMILVCLTTLAACTQPVSTPPLDTSPIPTRVLPTTSPPRALLPDGTTITLELAIDEEERRLGLMFRPSLRSTDGMLFLFEQPGNLSIWMKNTFIPLDIIFLDDTGTVVAISADAPPCTGEPCPQYRSGSPAHAVLEVAAGVAAGHGLAVGSVVHFEDVPGYPLT